MPVQIIQDGARNVIVKASTDLTSESGTLIDVSALDPPCTRVNINKIWFTTEDAAPAILTWAAAPNEIIAVLHGQQDFYLDFFGGLTNNAGGVAVTGDVLYAANASFTLVVHATKHGIIG